MPSHKKEQTTIQERFHQQIENERKRAKATQKPVSKKTIEPSPLFARLMELQKQSRPVSQKTFHIALEADEVFVSQKSTANHTQTKLNRFFHALSDTQPDATNNQNSSFSSETTELNTSFSCDGTPPIAKPY